MSNPNIPPNCCAATSSCLTTELRKPWTRASIKPLLKPSLLLVTCGPSLAASRMGSSSSKGGHGSGDPLPRTPCRVFPSPTLPSPNSEGAELLFLGTRTYRDSGTAARKQRTLGPRNSEARSGPGNTSPSSRPVRAQHPRSIRGAGPRGTRRQGRGSAYACQTGSSVTTVARPSRRRHELSGHPPLPAQPRAPTSGASSRDPQVRPSPPSPRGSRGAADGSQVGGATRSGGESVP